MTKFLLQKLTVQRVTIPKVPSDVASARTLRDRNRTLREQMLLTTSTPGGNDSSDYQLASLLKSKTRLDLQYFLETHHHLLHIKIPSGKELFLKIKLGWSWSQMRQMKV